MIQLRRQVEEKPASPTFAALAEECRKAGLFEEAIETARAALDRFPTYVSARVALGRALIEVGHIEEARAHLETVVDQAPENLAAINALAELHKRLRQEDVTDGGAEAETQSGPDAPLSAAGAEIDALLAPVSDSGAPNVTVEEADAGTAALDLDVALPGQDEPGLEELGPQEIVLAPLGDGSTEVRDDDPDTPLAALEALMDSADTASADVDTAALDTERPLDASTASAPAEEQPPLDDDPRVVVGLERLLEAILRRRAPRRGAGSDRPA